MNWRRTPEGWLCIPYSVKWRQGNWVAQRQATRFGLPEFIGTYETDEDAKQACAEYRERVSA